jgi:hypothetical protein
LTGFSLKRELPGRKAGSPSPDETSKAPVGAAGLLRPQKRVVNDFWDALMVVVVAALGHEPRLDMSVGSHQNAWNALKSLYQWMYKTTVNSGYAHVTARLKEFAADCRLAAIDERPVRPNRFIRAFIGPLQPLRRAMESPKRTPLQRDMVAQIGYLGRSLPKGRPQKEGKAALDAHYWALGSKADPLPEGRREELAKFAESWASKHLQPFVPHLEFDPSAGACLEKGRKKGGLAAFLHEEMRGAIGDIPRYVKKLTTYPVVEDDIAVWANSELAKRLARKLPTETPPAAAEIVCERGAKVRIVTKSPGALVAICHQARIWLAEGLRRDPSIRMVLAGDHRQAVQNLMTDRDGGNHTFPGSKTVVSSDLKSATDLIGRETYEAIWEGILRSPAGQSLPNYVKRAVALAIGPQVISYRDSGRHCHSKRGALMGLPTTWAFLCLANLAWWDIGHRIAHPKGKRPPKVTICGDDLVGVTSKEGAQEYEKAARCSGAVFSSAVKHIKSPHGGVFTEEVFYTETTPEKGFKFSRWSEAFPTRGLLGTMRSDRTGTEEPYWTSVGPAMERMMEHRGQRARRAILIAFRAAHPDLRGFLREHGLKRLFHVPRVFGGIGVPRWENLWDFKVSGEGLHLRSALALAAGSRWDSDLAVLSRPYSRSLPTTLPLRRVAADMAELAIHGRWSVVKATATPPPGYHVFPEGPQSLLDRITGNVARDLFFLSDFDPTAPKASVKQSGAVARRLEREVYRAQVQVLTAKGGWTCGKTVTLNWQHALEKLQEIENSRVAIYNPALAPKAWRLDFQAWERIISARAEYEREPTPARAQRAPRRFELLPLPSQVLEERRRAAPSTGADRPMGLEAPFREWADRQTKRLVGEAMGWFHGA